MLDIPLLDRLRAAVTEVRWAPPPVTRRSAAVLLLIDPADPALPLLFMVRPETMRRHAGQIAFPGGGIEPTDADVVAAALRETNEEMGLDPNNVEVLGTLTPLMTAVSDLWLTPVVGLQRSPWEVVPDAVEVAQWFRVPLDDLMTADHEVRVMTGGGREHNVHFYTAGERIIWGVSGAILSDLLQRLGRTD